MPSSSLHAVRIYVKCKILRYCLLVLSHITIKLDVHCDVVSRELPGVEVEPVIRDLDLVPIDNFLLEDAISITETITPGRVVERGETVEEAGG